MVAGVLRLYTTAIPLPQPDNISPTEFSEGRAWKHLLTMQAVGKSTQHASQAL